MKDWFFNNLYRAIESITMSSDVEIVTPEFSAYTVNRFSRGAAARETVITGPGDQVWMFKTCHQHTVVVAQGGDYIPDENGEFKFEGAEHLPLGFQWAVVPFTAVEKIWDSFKHDFIKPSRPDATLVLVGMPKVISFCHGEAADGEWDNINVQLDPVSEFLRFSDHYSQEELMKMREINFED